MHRKKNKRDFRSVWLIRLNIFCKLNNINYNRFRNILFVNRVLLNNKILGNLLLFDPSTLVFLIKKFK